jgi:hypothetical protein
MSAGSVIITDSADGNSVNLTKSASVRFTGNNPLNIIPVPADASSADTIGGAEAMDFKMMTDNIIITFKLGFTGVDADDALGAFDMATPDSHFEKLRYLFKYDTGKKKLTIGATVFWVVISNLDIPIDQGTLDASGKLSSENCTMTLTVVNPG